MAFNVQYLSLCSYSTNEAAPSIFSYGSKPQTDEYGTVIDSGDTLGNILDVYYFKSIAKMLRVNDVIYISDNTNTQAGKGIYYVSESNEATGYIYLDPLVAQVGTVTDIRQIDCTDSATVGSVPDNDNPMPDWVVPVGAKVIQMDANVRYQVYVGTKSVTKYNVYFRLPPVNRLNVGNASQLTNQAGVGIGILQNSGQAVYFPDGTQTVEGVTGALTSTYAGDFLTLTVTYNNVYSTDPVIYGTDFNMITAALIKYNKKTV